MSCHAHVGRFPSPISTLGLSVTKAPSGDSRPTEKAHEEHTDVEKKESKTQAAAPEVRWTLPESGVQYGWFFEDEGGQKRFSPVLEALLELEIRGATTYKTSFVVKHTSYTSYKYRLTSESKEWIGIQTNQQTSCQRKVARRVVERLDFSPCTRLWRSLAAVEDLVCSKAFALGSRIRLVIPLLKAPANAAFFAAGMRFGACEFGWHGFAKSPLALIWEESLLPQFCVTDLYGRGVYFAKKPHFSLDAAYSRYLSATPNNLAWLKLHTPREKDPPAHYHKAVLFCMVNTGPLLDWNEVKQMPDYSEDFFRPSGHMLPNWSWTVSDSENFVVMRSSQICLVAVVVFSDA